MALLDELITDPVSPIPKITDFSTAEIAVYSPKISSPQEDMYFILSELYAKLKTFDNFDVVVGTGETYTEPADAFTAGFRRMKLSSNVTITKTTTFTGFVFIDTNGYTMTFTGQTLTLSSETVFAQKSKLVGNLVLTNNSCTLFNVTLTGTLGLTSDYNDISNCDISGLVTLNSGSEYNRITVNRLRTSYTNSSGNTTNVIKDNV